MATCCLAQGDLDNSRRHGLQALSYLGAPFPTDIQAQSSRLWLLSKNVRINRFTVRGLDVRCRHQTPRLPQLIIYVKHG